MFTDRSPRDVHAIVEAQVGKWALQSKVVSRREPQGPWPLITISREFGSQGAAVGKAAATRLGFGFWDQELVAAIAEETGAQQTLVASLDEKARNRLEDFISEVVTGSEGTVGEYVRQVARVVGVIEDHGGAVVIGRGAQFILDPDKALRVRVICPFEQRVVGFAEREGLTRREAERIVRQVERERQSFNRRHYGREVGDPVHYDLVFNSGFYSLQAAAELLVEAYAKKFGRLPATAAPVLTPQKLTA